jgi:hypothetical protein
MIASRAIEYMEAELAGPLASEFAGFDLVNGAARLMESLFEWRYLKKTARSISLRANVTGTGATFTAATGQLASIPTGGFANYTLVPGDHIELFDGETLLGRFNVRSQSGDDAIIIDAPGLTSDITATVNFTLDCARIALPTDVHRLIQVDRGRPNSGGAFPTTLEEIQSLDESYITGSSYVTGYTFEWGTATAKSIPVPVLRVWPPSLADDVDAMSCVYLRAWPTVDNEDDILAFPEHMNTLFLEICRAYARGYEDQARLDVAVQGIKDGTIYHAATKYESGGMRTLGKPRNGAVRHRTDNLSDTSATFVHYHLEQ